ncbi:MAG: DUF58 domain-containing protein [Planctomycetaceae bacterium]
MGTANSTLRGGQSLPGLLAVLLGGGGLFVAWKFPGVIDGWSTTQKYIGLIVAVFLLLWGIDRQLPEVRSTLSGGRFRRTRHTVMLPRQGITCLVIMAVLFIGSMIGRSNMLMLVFAMMAGPFVVNGWIIFSMLKKLSVDRRVPTRTMAGEPAVIELGITNGKRWISNWLMSISDTIENSRERLNTGVLFTRVPPKARSTGHYHVRLMQRGKYEFGPLHVTTRFPLGLVERGLLFDKRDQIVVYPRLGRLSSSWKRDHLLAADLVQQRQPRRGAFDDEFHRIREYRWGDNPRAIHWRTSARHNQLMVRQYRQSRDHDLMVILDLFCSRRPTTEERERVELAVSLAATICVEHMRESRDSRLCVLSAGNGVDRFEGESAAAFRDSLLDLLAVVESSPAPPIEKVLDEAAAKRRAMMGVILISSRTGADMNVLNAVLADRAAAESLGDVQMIAADPRQVASFFELH